MNHTGFALDPLSPQFNIKKNMGGFGHLGQCMVGPFTEERKRAKNMHMDCDSQSTYLQL